ncbi:MAG: JmjC domain, hydroxylase-domain-containing protein [Linnemannia elongata]|nr:MAG: JmjC domain, hydroxylase-domain-containing protein [Linnemannia elongata]
MDQFKDFSTFCESIVSYGREAGLVKIIPPKEWTAALPDLSERLSSVRIKTPIIQHIRGTKGIYSQTNIESRKTYTVAEFKALSNDSNHRPPSRKAKAAEQERIEPPMTDYKVEHGEDFTVDYCKEVERNYWRNLTFVQPMYGADMSGSLFDESTTSWNTQRLGDLLCKIDQNLPGVNTPYLYFGMWKATFAWHVEDMDLYSINYLHFGAPKQWYCIRPENSSRFERIAQGIFSSDYKNCPQFLRHKTYLLSPTKLAADGVPVNRLVQHEGEFVLTFPFAYHSGYNLGFNCAESINFALDDWIPIGQKAESCRCINDAVQIDVDAIFQKRGATKEQCVLCPNQEFDGELLPTSNGKHCHMLCAQYIPETYMSGEDDDDVIVHTEGVPAARRRLRCFVCEKKVGACVQCCKGKCIRAVHASCAEMEGMYIDEVEHEDESIEYQLYCPTHDPEKEKEAGYKAWKDMMAKKLKPGLSVWARWNDNVYYSGVIETILSDRLNCKIQFHDGYVKTVTWKDISLDKKQPPTGFRTAGYCRG